MRKITLLLALSLALGYTGFSQDNTANSSKSDTAVTDTILPFQQQDLKEVKVVAKKKLIEQKIDKMVPAMHHLAIAIFVGVIFS